MKTANFKRLWPISAPRGRRQSWLAVAMAVSAAFTAHALPFADTMGGGRLTIAGPDWGNADGSTFLDAQYNFPSGLALDSAGTTLFVADYTNNAIRSVTLTANLADSVTASPLKAANSISKPVGVVLDQAGFIYVLNRGNGNDGRVLKFNSSLNLVRTNAASLTNATAIALDGSTNIYVLVRSNTVMRFSNSSTNVVGVVTNAGASLRGLAIMDNGMLAITDAGRHGILLLNPSTGSYSNLTGFNGIGNGFGDAPFVKFTRPEGIAKAGGGTLVVCDRGNHQVKTVDAAGKVSLLYGVYSTNWTSHPGYFFSPGWFDGAGLLQPIGTNTDFAEARDPYGVVVTPTGDVIASETYYHILRKTTTTGLTGPTGGGGGGTNVVNVPPPTISPNSGYYPEGVTVTVSSPNPDVFYTTDGTDPNTTSARVTMNGNVGSIRYFSSTNDLTGLRVRAFVGSNTSAVVTGVSVGTNSVGVPPGPDGVIHAGVGATIWVPVVINLRTNDLLMSYTYVVAVTPNGGAASIQPDFGVVNTHVNDLIPVKGPGVGGVPASFNSEVQLVSPPEALAFRIHTEGTGYGVNFRNFACMGLLRITMPDGAVPGQTYSISVNDPTATSDGLGQTVNLYPMAPTTIVVTNIPYVVGDCSPANWYNAGEFGDGRLQNSDVNVSFAAALGVRLLPDEDVHSDLFNCMNAFYLDTPFTPGGDTVIDAADWNRTLIRATGADTSNWLRAWDTGGNRTNASTSVLLGSADGGGTVNVAAPWNRQATIGAVSVANALPNSIVNVPVYAKVADAATLRSAQFRAIVEPNNGAAALTQPIQFIVASGITNCMSLTGTTGQIGCGWPYPKINCGSRSSNYLGNVRFVVPASATAGQTYTVRFGNVSGMPDLNTGYTLDSKRATILIGGAAQQPADPCTDEWKTHFFGSLTSPSASGTADPDGDGVNNSNEFIAGTDPMDALSKLHFVKCERRVVSGQAQNALHWLSAPGKAYEILASSSLGGAWAVIGAASGSGDISEFTETNPGNGPRFYKLRVLP